MSRPFEQPGVYTIHVGGYLDRSWSDRVGGLSVVSRETAKEGQTMVSTLVGVLPDQAALIGVLNFLYDNRLAVLYVQYLRPEANESAA